MSIQTLLKRSSGLLRIPGNTYMMFRPNHVGGSKPCDGSTLLSHAVLQTQSRLCMSSTTNLRSLAILNGPHQVHLATKVHKLDTQQTRRLPRWADYPAVHEIKVKGKGKNADWENVEALVTLYYGNYGKRGRARRVWTPVSTEEKVLSVNWPEGEQAIRKRRLHDPEHGELDKDRPDEVPKDVYTVTEKLDVDGRRFWREVIPRSLLRKPWWRRRSSRKLKSFRNI